MITLFDLKETSFRINPLKFWGTFRASKDKWASCCNGTKSRYEARWTVVRILLYFSGV